MDAELERATGSRITFGSPELMGLLVGIGIVGSLLGEVAGLPSRYLADLAILAAVAVAWRSGEVRIAVSRNVGILLGLIALYFLLVVASAREPQWAFLLHPGQWRGHAADYADAKLLMFAITFLGPVAGALIVMFAWSKERMVNVILWTVVVLGVLAVARLATFWNVLIGTDDDVARTFFINGARGFSPVSYGLLFLFAGIAALFLPIRIISALFLTVCFIIHRRTETVLLLIAILAYGTNEALLRGHRRALIVAGGIVVVAGILILILHNGSSVAYWSALGGAVETRTTIATAGLTEASSHGFLSVLFGHGLGSAATSNAQWPHNLLLETYIESGALTLVALLAVLAWSAAIAGPAKIIAESGVALCTAALAVAVFAFSMKSTDVTSAGTLVAWVLMAVALSAPARRAAS